MVLTKWAARGVGGVSSGRRERARLRPAIAGAEPPLELETRLVPTFLLAPIYNPQFGVTTTLSEFNGTVVATISLDANATTALKGYYQSSVNATANPTVGGPHNNDSQATTGALPFFLVPGQTIILALPEGPSGTYHAGQPDEQLTGTQFDVFVDPINDFYGTQTANVAGAIAYNPKPLLS